MSLPTRLLGAATGTATALGAVVSSALSDATTGAARRVANRIPVADLDDRDPDYIRETLPGLWLLATLYFRGEVRNIERIPAKGPVLLVGNHSGGNLTPDTFILTMGFANYFGVERRFHALAHNLVVSWPVAGAMLRRWGVVAASPDNAKRLLRAGGTVLVYPGGDYEVYRPSWEGNRVDFGGRKGFITLALEAGVPIVPVVSIGGQETALFLSRGEWLARLLRLDRLLRLKSVPIALSLPTIINVSDLAGHLPLPARITVQVLDPIDLRAEFGPEPDLDAVYTEILGRMQTALDGLAAERRLPVLG